MQKIIVILLLLCNFSMLPFAQLPNIDSLIKIVADTNEDTGKVIAFRMLAGLVVSTNPLKAVTYGKAGAALGKKIGFYKGVAGCYLNLAGAYSAGGKLDSALLYIDTAINWSLKVGEPGRIALAYLNKADYERQTGNFIQALKNCDTSMLYAEKANKDDAKARIYQTIGSVYHAQDNYGQSKAYYEKAYQLYEKGNNKKMMAISMNNLGNVFKHEKQYERAVASFQNAIRLAGEIGDENNMAMYYSNMGDVYAEQGDLPSAEISTIKSLELARKQENDLQIIESQSVLADVYLKMGKVKQAIRSATEGYSLSTDGMISERQILADELAEGFFKDGNQKEAYKYLLISKSLSDSIAKAKYNNELTGMQVKFKVDEKDKEILLLAKDKELQLQQIKQQRYLMIGAAAIAILSLIGIWQFINRNRLRQRMKELELRNQIAADLHDEVGSSLSSIHMLSQMANTQSDTSSHQKNILDKVSSNAKETMDRMSDIVWMIKPGETEAGNLKQRMERFAYEICSSKNMEVTLQLNELERIKLTMEQRKNIYLIFKEAINNAVKYSGTEKIEVISAIQNNKLLLSVKDFGNGFNVNLVKKGNGLDNMQHRAKESGGILRTETAVNTGTTIQLIVPV